MYLLSPSSKSKAHGHKVHSSKPQATTAAAEPEVSTPVPVKDDEGTEVSAQEVEESMQKAFVRDVVFGPVLALY